MISIHIFPILSPVGTVHPQISSDILFKYRLHTEGEVAQ